MNLVCYDPNCYSYESAVLCGALYELQNNFNGPLPFMVSLVETIELATESLGMKGKLSYLIIEDDEILYEYDHKENTFVTIN